MIEQLALVIIGLIIGTVIGVEYSAWRLSRKFIKPLMQFVGFNKKYFNRISPKEKKEYVGKIARDFFDSLFPQEKLVPPSPSKIVNLSGNEFFVPRCPKCGEVEAPVPWVPGATVEGACFTHGVFHVKIPKKEKEE